MNIMKNYWPSAENIQTCIRTEAEEQDTDVLLAVHEPMCLQRCSDNENIACGEQEVLASLYASERPIPIIGRSGVGKSHLIRWLDAKLRQDPHTATWHIVRIPKNASLRQVLEFLLAGVEGDVFDQARARVVTVTEALKTDELAKLLLTFMDYHLTARGNQILQQARANLISAEQQKKMKLTLSQLDPRQPNNLQALIGDSMFKTKLLAQHFPVYQCALRMTKGEAHDDELWNVIPPEILDFSDTNLDDLSLHARQYVARSGLNTDANVRQDVAQLLSEALSDATQKVFGHLFQFDGAGFQDVFRQIRRVLLEQGKTLCILIEDMAAISAIENILIDSLLEESIRDGERQLCTLRSAIAVTDGYIGYTRRQDTLRTRAVYEWRILDRLTDHQTDDLEQVTQRVINLYGRYVNAARWGQQLLKQQSLTEGQIAAWDDADVEVQVKEAFGYSDQGYNLYPLSRNALSTLVQKYCQREQQWFFNPRAVLNHIVLPTLRHQPSQFPPEGWLGIDVRSDIRRELSRLRQPERSCTVAAIWGGQARHPAQLKESLSPAVAQAFALDDLADWLQQSSETSSPAAQRALPITTHQTKAPNLSQSVAKTTLEPADPLEAIEQEIGGWLDPQRAQKLSQGTARILRKSLADLYKAHAQPKDYGFGKLPELKPGKINIYAAYTGNDESNHVWFVSELDFENEQRRYELKSVVLALLRHHHFKAQQAVDWNYPQGLEDYFVYQAFVTIWVPAVVKSLLAMEKTDIHSAFGKQYLLARQLGLRPLQSLPMLADVLLKQQPLSNPDLLDVLKPLYQPLTQQWEMQQQIWVSRLTLTEYRALRLWTLESALSGQSKVMFRSDLSRICRDLYKRINEWSHYQLLKDLQSKEQFSHLVSQFKESIDHIMMSGQFYPKRPNFPNNKSVLQALDRLSAPTGWEHVQKLQFLHTYQTELPPDDQTLDKILSYFSQLQHAVVSDLNLLIEAWQGIYSHSLSPMEAQNRQQGSDQLHNLEQQCKDLLDQLYQQLYQCEQVIK